MTTVTEKTIATEYRRSFPGTVFTVLVPAAKTNNNLFVAEVQCLPGGEPPRHVHTAEDEVAIVREGSVTYFLGDEIIQASAGDTVFLPKNVPHHFVITSSFLKVILVASPGNFGEFFNKLSVPYDGSDIPAPQRPSESKLQQVSALMNEYGIHYV